MLCSIVCLKTLEARQKDGLFDGFEDTVQLVNAEQKITLPAVLWEVIDDLEKRKGEGRTTRDVQDLKRGLGVWEGVVGRKSVGGFPTTAQQHTHTLV